MQSGALSRLGGRRWADSARAAVLPFILTRAVVIGALVFLHFLLHTLHPAGPAGLRAVGTARSGLMAWDAAWYERIASFGYARAGRQSLRFFPLYPLLGHYLSLLPGFSVKIALLTIANLCAFAALVVLHRLVGLEQLARGSDTRSLYVFSLWPAAFVLVMGYSEGLLILLSLLTFYLLRTGRPAWSVLPSLLAGAARPVGLLLVVPALVEAFAWWRKGKRGRSHLLGWSAAAAAAPLGAVAYLGWVAARYGDFLLPFSLQTSSRHRGLIADPFVTLYDDGRDLLSGHHLGTALHAPFLVAFIALTIYLFFRLPAAYGWYALATMAVAATAPNLDSLERYGLACFPLSIALACLLGRGSAERVVLGGMATVLFAIACLAFAGLYVP